ncbi:MAG: hypothetical protein LQ343_000109 [Gyalolechia ehrenbergii]|nr:MAG: hypothetical protein LQ343_000109 [Gyalolechia ehrenbergii]
MDRSIIYERLRSIQSPAARVGIACIYCDIQQRDDQTPERLLASVWPHFHLGNEDEIIPPYLDQFYRMHLQARTRPDIDEIQSTIQIAINNLEKAYILIDGFDECTDTDRRRIFTESIKSLLDKSNSKLSVLITSRLENQLYKGISIKIEATQDEITSIVTKRMLAYQLLRKSLTDQVMEEPDLQKEIIEKIFKGKRDVFNRWAVQQVPIAHDKYQGLA